jgi:hypothetical protein
MTRDESKLFKLIIAYSKSGPGNGLLIIFTIH